MYYRLFYFLFGFGGFLNFFDLMNGFCLCIVVIIFRMCFFIFLCIRMCIMNIGVLFYGGFDFCYYECRL